MPRSVAALIQSLPMQSSMQSNTSAVFVSDESPSVLPCLAITRKGIYIESPSGADIKLSYTKPLSSDKRAGDLSGRLPS
jgi:hypothetical protein